MVMIMTRRDWNMISSPRLFAPRTWHALSLSLWDIKSKVPSYDNALIVQHFYLLSAYNQMWGVNHRKQPGSNIGVAHVHCPHYPPTWLVPSMQYNKSPGWQDNHKNMIPVPHTIYTLNLASIIHKWPVRKILATNFSLCLIWYLQCS